jgi:mono/diheme cytochrome c family protein
MILWSIGLVVLVALVAAFFVRGSGISARRTPFVGEERLARAAWRFLVPHDLRDAANPVPNSPEVLQKALEHFADHCALCHGNDGSGDTVIGRRVFPVTPDLRAARTQNLTDGELFYAIEQGVPWTAMPAWTTGTEDGARESWELVRFIRHLPAITAAELTQMESLNPRSPAQDQRDRDIDDFLRGGGSPPKAKPGHSHGKGGSP